jgi:hypothetical protein
MSTPALNMTGLSTAPTARANQAKPTPIINRPVRLLGQYTAAITPSTENDHPTARVTARVTPRSVGVVL